MPGKIIKIIPVTPDLSVILHHAPNLNDGAYISIKQNEKVNNLPGEITLIPNVKGVKSALDSSNVKGV